MKYGVFAFLLVSILISDIQAQYTPTFTMQSMLPAAINPSFVGSQEAILLSSQLRFQWVGLEGSPQTQRIHINAPLAFLKGGAGVTIDHDQLGAEHNWRLALHLARKVTLQNFNIGVGVSLNYQHKVLNGGDLITPEGDYGSIVNHNDVLLPIEQVGQNALDLGVGIRFETKIGQFGISAQNLLPKTYQFVNEFDVVENTPILNFIFANKFDFLNNRAISPSLWVKSDGTTVQLLVQTLYHINDVLEVGIGCRGYEKKSLESVYGIVGIELKEGLKLNYSYDFILNSIKNPSSGSHELMIRYIFGQIFQQSGGKIRYNPRFM